MLPPGNYTVESEEPLVSRGRTYEWRQIVDVTAGRDATLELTADNAVVGVADTAPTAAGTPPKTDPWDLLVQWQDSVVAVWTPLTHASGVVVASSGLIATTQRVVRDASHVQVQLAPTLKVAARVLVADDARDVALLWIDPAALGSRQPLPLACGSAPRPAISRGQPISAIGTPVRRQPTTTRGAVSRVDAGALAATFDVPIDSAGGPVFAADGALVGLTSLSKGMGGDGATDANVVRVDAVCEVVAMAQARTTGAAPSGTPLPVEPAQVVTDDALREEVKRRIGSLTPSKATSSGFDIDFITPEMAYAGLQQTMDFGQWTGYVADHPAVLLVRVTPKQVESLWLKVARGAAMTQGIALPPITHYEPGFARMRVVCGGREVTPIHPFVVERRVSESAAIREGLYVFAPDALGPHCGTATLELFSETSPDERDSARIDALVLQRVWDDLAPYRSQTAAR
jgi:S1-C subfamily serine protease